MQSLFVVSHIAKSNPRLEEAGYRCVACEELFATPPLLVAHQSRFHRESFQCAGCGKRFDSHRALRAHSKARQHLIPTLFAHVGECLLVDLNALD